MNTDYQTLLNSLFICGVNPIDVVIKNEDIDVVLDLRPEAIHYHQDNDVKRLQVPLEDGVANQIDLLQRAIKFAGKEDYLVGR